jgi:hypothetical protein
MLTKSERVHFDLNGFVLLKKILSEEECRWIAQVAALMKQASIFPRYDSPNQTVLFGPTWYDQRVLSLAMETRLRAKAEDIVGGSSRLEESSFLICSPHNGHGPATESRRWHRGLMPDFGSFESAAHYHCLFSKMILYLSPRGHMTGTWVIPGSHKLQISIAEFTQVFQEDMAYYVDAEPGDVLLFGETLIHSSPPLSQTQERLLLVIAYSAPFMQTWNTDTDPPATLSHKLTDDERRFVFGEARYKFRNQSEG